MLAAPLYAPTPAPGCPAPQTLHPPGARRSCTSHLWSRRPPPGPGLPQRHHGGGQTWGGSLGPCPLVLAPRLALSPGVPRPVSPARCSPSRRCRWLRKAALPSVREREGGGGEDILEPHPIAAPRIPHPPRHPPPGRALATAGTGRLRGTGAAGRRRVGESCPAAPRSPCPREALRERERGAEAARRGGGCHGAGTIKPGVIAFRQMRLPRPSPSPGI